MQHRCVASTSHFCTLRRQDRSAKSSTPIERNEQAIIYVIITIVTVLVNAAGAVASFARAKFIVDTFADILIPATWLPALATLQVAGAAGLLLGLIGVPIIGLAAAVGLVLYFIGAVVTHLRSRSYRSLPSPILMLALAVATLIFTAIR